MQERGNRRQHHWVSICEPYSQILTHVMVGGAISYDRVYGKRLKIKNVVRSDRGHTWWDFSTTSPNSISMLPMKDWKNSKESPKRTKIIITIIIIATTTTSTPTTAPTTLPSSKVYFEKIYFLSLNLGTIFCFSQDHRL